MDDSMIGAEGTATLKKRVAVCQELNGGARAMCMPVAATAWVAMLLLQVRACLSDLF
jgi:hypothetical protein